MKIELMIIIGIALEGIFKDPLVRAIKKKQMEANTNKYEQIQANTYNLKSNSELHCHVESRST